MLCSLAASAALLAILSCLTATHAKILKPATIIEKPAGLSIADRLIAPSSTNGGHNMPTTEFPRLGGFIRGLKVPKQACRAGEKCTVTWSTDPARHGVDLRPVVKDPVNAVRGVSLSLLRVESRVVRNMIPGRIGEDSYAETTLNRPLYVGRVATNEIRLAPGNKYTVDFMVPEWINTRSEYFMLVLTVVIGGKPYALETSAPFAIQKGAKSPSRPSASLQKRMQELADPREVAAFCSSVSKDTAKQCAVLLDRARLSLDELNAMGRIVTSIERVFFATHGLPRRHDDGQSGIITELDTFFSRFWSSLESSTRDLSLDPKRFVAGIVNLFTRYVVHEYPFIEKYIHKQPQPSGSIADLEQQVQTIMSELAAWRSDTPAEIVRFSQDGSKMALARFGIALNTRLPPQIIDNPEYFEMAGSLLQVDF